MGRRLLAVMVLLSFVSLSFATYPTGPIKVVVPYSAGGASDVQVRIIGKYVKQLFGWDFAVVNITSGGGSTGAREVLKAKPDGYTVLWYHQSVFSNYHVGTAEFNYYDFTPVCIATRGNRVVIARPDSPWKNLRDAIEDAKKNPGKIRLGVEIGATSHFQAIPIQLAANNGFILSASSGGDMDRITKIMGGHMDLSPIALSAAVPFFKSGELKPLAVLSPERDPFLPNVPTAKELGLEELVFTQDQFFLMPKGTPTEIVKTFANAIKQVLQLKECADELAEKAFAIPFYMDGEEMLKFLKWEDERFDRFARAAGLKK
ncbi:tripartite tricarboxylate transporter substrate binding protein [Pseudothermotoga sp.]|nr:tripartite tricarboxylate transporter substrate binding protein [Pseudothermotoga sp.]MDW8140109.1 tripartite tricarboxylate transporter substrate binding protein [Pseudothermotoga sp.]